MRDTDENTRDESGQTTRRCEPGEFVLIGGGQVLGFYANAGAAGDASREHQVRQPAFIAQVTDYLDAAPASGADQFEQERRFFHRHVEDLKRNSEGRFALVKDSELVGVFPTVEAACEAGVRRFHPAPFFIGEIPGRQPTLVLTANTMYVRS